MATKQYLGSGLYEIHIGHQKITLSEDEVQELCEDCQEKVEKLETMIEIFETILEKKDVEILRLMDEVAELHQR